MVDSVMEEECRRVDVVLMVEPETLIGFVMKGVWDYDEVRESSCQMRRVAFRMGEILPS